MGQLASIEDIKLMIESARDIVSELKDLSCDLDELLDCGAPIDEVISLLETKKVRVDALRELSMRIKAELRVDQSGRVGTALPEDVKISFGDLMAALNELIEVEIKLERLLCSRGIPISGRIS